MAQRLTIIKIRPGGLGDVNQELQWLGNSLGLFNMRDRESSCFRVFITLVRRSQRNQPISSDEIAQHLNLSRGTVVHHLTKLMGSGLVVREKEKYILRENHLENLIKDLQRDVEGTFAELQEIARKIDEQLG